MLKSSLEYRKWWMHNRPSTIPKNPNRAYASVWMGWGDFLGTYNPFPCSRRKFRPYKEARAWAQTLGFTTKAQWMAHCKAKDFPADVPKRPDIYYFKSKDWLTWKDFLGYRVSDRVAALSETDHIIYVIQYPELPTNVFTLGITAEGKSGLITRQQQYGFAIIAAYYHDKQSDWMGKLKPFIRPYHVGERNFICNNVAEIISVLSMDYLVVR
jgi:hypothetical protein